MTKPVEKIVINGKSYTKFIHFPKQIRDGTFRCIRCGQIDEEPYHDPQYCPACKEYRP